MPKSDTWPGGTGLETTAGMDSAGSCDSVVSVNSRFSDDSLEHLSAEEKACLMFLEETIESLDTEEDSGLSNDEPDQPVPENLDTKMAKLSTCMSTSKRNSAQMHDLRKRSIEVSEDHKSIHSYLVPTPLVLANSSATSVHKNEPVFLPRKNSFHPKPPFNSSNSKPGPGSTRQELAPPVPSEVNVVVIPPPTKPKKHWGRTGEGLPRGPLSYDALVHLRRSASVKKSPLCPTVDHTIDLAQDPPASMEGVYQNHINLARAPSAAPTQDPTRPKTSPPAVAPKPQKKPAHVSINLPNETAAPSPDSSSSGNCAADPQKARMEALKKLGLLNETDERDGPVTILSQSASQTAWDLSSQRFIRDSARANPSRSPSFSYSQVPTEPKVKPVHSSASFHHYSPRCELSSACPSQPAQTKMAAPENSVTGADLLRRPSRPAAQPGSASLGIPKSDGRNQAPAVQPKTTETVKTATAAQPRAKKNSNAVGYTVMMVPGMGADRKEALRKLGLLKE